jgi:outer membrane immunogenic protein
MLASATVVAGAADAPPVYRAPPPPYYLWTGFYAGAHIGAGWASDGGDGGFIGGGQIGYNYQVDNHWVVGIEADLTGTTIGTSVNVNAGYGVTESASGGLDWIATLTPRVGYAFDRWLVYSKAGVAWAHSSASGAVSVPGFGTQSWSVSSTGSAFVFGVGTEYALHGNWTAKLEYNVFGFDNDVGGTFQTIKAGVNYRFSGF